MASITINDPKVEKPITFYLEDWVKKIFDEKVKPDLKLKDKDCIIAMDGREGSGKSTLALQWCKYVDPTFNLSRVVFTPEGFRDAIHKAKPGQAVMFDEAFTGFSSRAALSGVNKTLISLMMQARQKNLFIMIVLPTFFLLDKYISVFRTRVLVHVYENKGRRGFFRVYSKKKKRSLIMSKEARTYSYGVRSNQKGRFYGVFALGGEEEERKYREKKLKALDIAHKNPMNSSQAKYRGQRNIAIYLLRKNTKLSYRELATLFGEYDFEISYIQIRDICVKFGDSEEKKQKIRHLNEEYGENEEESYDFDEESEEIEEDDPEITPIVTSKPKNPKNLPKNTPKSEKS